MILLEPLSKSLAVSHHFLIVANSADQPLIGRSQAIDTRERHTWTWDIWHLTLSGSEWHDTCQCHGKVVASLNLVTRWSLTVGDHSLDCFWSSPCHEWLEITPRRWMGWECMSRCNTDTNYTWWIWFWQLETNSLWFRLLKKPQKK